MYRIIRFTCLHRFSELTFSFNSFQWTNHTEKTAFANYYSNDIIGLARNLVLRLARVLRCKSEALTEYGAEHGNTGEEEADGIFEIDS